MAERVFPYAVRARIAARGFARFSLLAALVLAAFAALVLTRAGIGVFLFLVLSLYFLGLGLFQWRQARGLADAALLVDDAGFYLRLPGREGFWPADQAACEPATVSLLLGIGGKRREYRALLVGGRDLVVDLETRAAPVAFPRAAGGRPFLLSAADYDVLLAELGARGWLRPAIDHGSPDPATLGAPGGRAGTGTRFRLLAGGALACLAAYFFVDSPRLGIAFLLGAVGLGALAVLALRARRESPRPRP